MPNRNYQNGANFERAIVNRHRGFGDVAVRSAGSKGFSDVIILQRKGGILSIQCKIMKLSPKEREEAIAKFKKNAKPLKDNKVVCLLYERYGQKEYHTDVTKEVYGVR